MRVKNSTVFIKQYKNSESYNSIIECKHSNLLSFTGYSSSLLSIDNISFLGCGHCKKMKPEYIEAAKRMKDENVRK